MSRKKREKIKQVRVVIHIMNQCILSFDDVLKNGKMQDFHHLRTTALLLVLNTWRKQRLITDEEQDNIDAMLRSVDRDDWYMAFMVIRGKNQQINVKPPRR